jgi:5-methylcytosine-specific restriction protein B
MRAEAGTDQGLDRIWRTSILPLLEELHYGDQSIDVTHRYGLAALRSTVRALSSAPVAGEASGDDA